MLLLLLLLLVLEVVRVTMLLASRVILPATSCLSSLLTTDLCLELLSCQAQQA